MSVRKIQTPESFAELYRPARYKVYWGGRGGAKSTAVADALLAQADERPLRILCAREIQNSIRESVYQLLRDRIAANGFPYEAKDAEIVHPNGSQFFFAGLWRNIDSIKSIEGVDRVWVEEANRVSEDSWRKLIPTIRKSGSEIWVTFNPELKVDPAYQRFILNPPPKAIVRKVSWRDNPWFTQELRDEMEHLRETNYEEYLHVWEGELKQFADGSIYRKELESAKKEGRITKVPIQTGEPVHTGFDLGHSDSTAIWFFQRVGLQTRVIDYYENRLVGLEHYIKVLKDKDYVYGKHYLPHDVEHKILGMNLTRREQLEAHGIRPVIVVPRIGEIDEGINMARNLFSSCWFDEDRCAEGLDKLAAYKYEYDAKHDTFRKFPAHNYASHCADAFRTFAQGFAPDRGWESQVNPSGMSPRRAERLKGSMKPQIQWIT